MKQWEARLKFMAGFLVIGATAFVLNSCGGGGGGSSTPTSTATPATKSAATSTTATQAGLKVATVGTTGHFPKGSLKGGIGGKTAAWQDFFKAKADRKAHYKLGTTTTPCTSGTESETTAFTASTHTFTDTITAANCVIDIPGPTPGTSLGSIAEDGTLVVTEINPAYTGTDPTLATPPWDPTSIDVASAGGFTFTLKDAGGVVTEMFKITGNVTTTFVNDPTTGYPTSGSLASTMSVEIQNNNGTTDPTDDTHEVLSLTNFTDTLTFDKWDTKGNPTHIIDITGGTIAIDDKIHPINNVTITFTNFKMDDTTTTTTVNMVAVVTHTVLISGQINTPCLGGAITLATTTPIVVSGDACPTAGVITATGTGGTATITFTSTGGVHVVNPDGTTQDFAKCDDATAC